MIVSSPLTVNNRHIPNEDCRNFELDDTTLFLPNRFDGMDRVDAGVRAIAGLENELRFSGQRSVALFLGQSRRLDHQNVAGLGHGEDDKTSDLIMRLRVQPASYLSGRYRMGYNPTIKAVRFSETGLSLGEPKFKLNLGYVYLNKMATLSGHALSQVNMHVSSKITDTWSVSVGQIRNLRKSSGGASLATFVAAGYEDECFAVNMGIYKSGKNDRDLRSETAFMLRLTFKTLSDVMLQSAPTYPMSHLTKGL
jgi:LPS-assembly protein